MLKKLLIVLLMLPAGAQGLPLVRTSVVGAVGGSFPVSPESFTDGYGTGVALAGGLRFHWLPRIAVGLDVGYYRHGADTDTFLDPRAFPNVSVSGGDLWVVPVTAVAELDLLGRGSSKPFLRAGAGVFKIGVSDFVASGPGAETVTFPDPSDTVFGWLLGIGVRTPIALSVSLFLDATLHVAQTEGDATVFLPVRAGVRF